MSSVKKVLGNAALAVFALALALALGEIAVRLLFKDAAVLFPRYHKDYRYGKYTIRGLRPNAEFRHTSVDGSWTFVTNGRGFRNTREFAYAKPAGTLRVLSLGDSHTQGYEVRQEFTFSAVAERVLRGRKVDAEVINAGVSGYSTAEAPVLLESEGYKYNPDVVVLGFYANDFEDNLKAGLFALDGRQRLAEQKYEHIPGVKIQNAIYSVAAVRWLSEHSYFYSMLFNGVWEYFKALATKAAKQAIVTEYAVASTSGPSEKEIDLAAALIERMQQFCADRGIRLIVVDIPIGGKHNHFASSFPPRLTERMKAAGVEYVTSQSLLADFDGAAEMHVAHGHHHISEFTHTLIGAEIGRRVLGPRSVVARQ
jgi:hypothetical protein